MPPGNFYINDKPTGAVVGAAALRRRAGHRHQRQGGLDVEPDALGLAANDQGDVRSAAASIAIRLCRRSCGATKNIAGSRPARARTPGQPRGLADSEYIIAKQMRAPAAGTTGDHGMRNGRGRSGERCRSTITATQTAANASSVPIETSSPSRSSGNRAGNGRADDSRDPDAVRGRTVSRMDAGEDLRQRPVVGHGVENSRLPIERDQDRRGQADDCADAHERLDPVR